MSSAQEIVERVIEEGGVVVFSKTYCPYCVRAKKLLGSVHADAKCIELDKRPDGAAIQDYLERKTGQRTVPNIFIHQQHVGGCDSLTVAHSNGRLNELLASK